jgi:hypothetical protein
MSELKRYKEAKYLIESNKDPTNTLKFDSDY